MVPPRPPSGAIGYSRAVAAARVLVRPPTLADEAEWLARMRASRRLHAPWIRMPVTSQTYRDYVARNAEQRREQRIVCRVEDGAIVGFVNISEIIRGPLSSAFLGYGGVAGFAGRGYMGEGLELVLREAFTTLRLHRLEANIQPGNLPRSRSRGAPASSARGSPSATSRSAAAGATTSGGRCAPSSGARAER